MYKLINIKTGEEAGFVTEEQKKETIKHPHTRNKYRFEKIESSSKPGIAKKTKTGPEGKK